MDPFATLGMPREYALDPERYLHSQVETPYGPRRLAYAGVWRYEPRTEKLDVFVSYPFANPWGHCFDKWGQNFVVDARPGAATIVGTEIASKARPE